VHFLTDFADEAVVLPATLAVGLLLFAQGWRRGAAAWLGAIGLTLGAVLLLKLLCGGVLPGAGLPSPELRSPSGHAAAAAVLYGGLTALLLVGPSAGRAAAIALGWAGLFALTRLALGVHTVPEVLVGGAVGIGGAASLRWLAGVRPPQLRRWSLPAAVAAVALLMHGDHLRLERPIDRMARDFAGVPPACRAAKDC
jgi:membrane-associated phospholipid phosphatase